MKSKEPMVPGQHDGASTDTEAELQLDTIAEAVQHFKTIKTRLLNVSGWGALSGMAPADFRLTDENGREVSRPAQKGDYFRINLPAPGTETGSGYDWVHIEDIEDKSNRIMSDEYVAVTVRPSRNPLNSEKDTAHFFREEATSTFLIRRIGTIVRAEVHGRNEHPNTDTQNLADRVRNFFVAIGAMLGFSKVQWKSLVNGLIEKT
jgi:hypothetical protein